MNDNDELKRKKSIDFKLRFQALEDTHEGVVLWYLNSKGARESKDLIWQVLRMCLLPLAHKAKGDLSEEKLRVMALEACNALENYASYIRQVFFLERPTQPIIMNGQNSISPQSQPLPTPQQSQPEQSPEPDKGLQLEKGAINVEDVDAVFGLDV
ncbi:MAG: hypothetical protein WBB28_08570 [Crinalium sp.]